MFETKDQVTTDGRWQLWTELDGGVVVATTALRAARPVLVTEAMAADAAFETAMWLPWAEQWQSFERYRSMASAVQRMPSGARGWLRL